MMSAMEEPRVPAPPPAGGDGSGGGAGGPASSSSPPAHAARSGDAARRPAVTRGRRIRVRVLIWGTTVLAIIGDLRDLGQPPGVQRRQLGEHEHASCCRTNRSATRPPTTWSNSSTRTSTSKKKSRSACPRKSRRSRAPLRAGTQPAPPKWPNGRSKTAKVQEAWKSANQAADQTLVNIVEGGKGPVAINDGVVTLDLAAVLNNITNGSGCPK